MVTKHPGLVELSYPAPTQQVTDSIISVSAWQERADRLNKDVEKVLEKDVFPWLLKGDARVSRIEKLIRTFMEVFGEAVKSNNWNGQSFSPVGLDKYLELSLKLITVRDPIYLTFIIHYENILETYVGLLVSLGLLPSPAHILWEKVTDGERYEFDPNDQNDLVGMISAIKTVYDAVNSTNPI